MPAWLAVTVQVPPETIVTVDPETVQTDRVVDESKVTASPELDDALTVNGPLPYARLISDPNVTVWVQVTAVFADACIELALDALNVAVLA